MPNSASLQFYFIEQNTAHFYCRKDKFNVDSCMLCNSVANRSFIASNIKDQPYKKLKWLGEES